MKNKNFQSLRITPPFSGSIAALIAMIFSAVSAQAANVALAWNRNTETNLAGYRLFYGTASRSYSASLPAGASVTNATVSNLLGGQTYYFTVTASNTAGLQSAYSSEVSYAVPVSNTAPFANGQSVTAAEDTARAILLSGSDVDGNPLTYAVVSPPSHGTLSGTAPNLTFTPAANYNGSDSFTFRANDGLLNSATATVLITVTAVNDTPVAIAQSVSTPENTAKAVTLGGTDIDGNTLTYAIVTVPAHGTLSGTAPSLMYMPAANFAGTDSFTFRDHDGIASSATATVSINVTAVNSAPIAIAQSVTTTAGTPKAITLTGTDADGDTLTYSVVAPPLLGTLGGTAPNLTYTPAAGGTGSDSFTFRVSDGTATSAPATVAITVTAAQLPAPWVTTDIGNIASSGNVSVANNTFTVEGAGSIGGTEDNCRFVHQPMSGNGEILVRLSAAQLSDSNACVGVMIRENLNSGARSDFVGLASDGSLRLHARSVTSGAARSYTYPGSGAPIWLRLVRTDNTFVAYQSGDGSNWIRLRGSKIVMAANVHVGLAVGSGTSNTLGRATFDQPTVVP